MSASPFHLSWPRITELEPGVPDCLKKREPNFVMIAAGARISASPCR